MASVELNIKLTFHEIGCSLAYIWGQKWNVQLFWWDMKWWRACVSFYPWFFCLSWLPAESTFHLWGETKGAGGGLVTTQHLMRFRTLGNCHAGMFRLTSTAGGNGPLSHFSKIYSTVISTQHCLLPTNRHTHSTSSPITSLPSSQGVILKFNPNRHVYHNLPYTVVVVVG